MAMTDYPNGIARPLIFGEVLFDCFPDGSKVLGGAPFNVAWHLQGFGISPLLLTCIGDDADGHDVLQQMRSWGMDTRGVQQNRAYPTGAVTITWHGNHHQFHIAPNQAYDHIDHDDTIDALRECKISHLYHGTLAARSPVSRATLQWLRQNFHQSTFIDINLRTPWWKADDVCQLMQGADWLKLNDDELREFVPGHTAPGPAAAQLAKQHRINNLVVTLGSRGALLLHNGKQYEYTAPKIDRLVDTVGAGDAFSAVLLLGLIRHWDARQLLGNAAEFAAAICTRRGATVTNKSFYEEFINRWEG